MTAAAGAVDGSARRRSLSLGVAQGMLILAALAGAVAASSGRSFATLLLATAPGGVAEMLLTARTLRRGVPLVTAFHVVGLVAQLTLAPATFTLWRVIDRSARRQEDERSYSP